MEVILGTSSEEGQSCDDLNPSTSEVYSNSASSEESATRGGGGAASGHVDQAFPEGPESFLGALQPPSEARFKQLASLQLLRAVYQEEEERDVHRLSVERVLQSAQRQNSAHKIRLALMQQHISHQLRIVEAQESRLAELLSHLQSLTSQPVDLSTQEGTVLQLIRDMNHVRAGNPREWPPFMAELLSYGEGNLKRGDPLRSVSQICEAFIKGYADSCHLQLSLPPFNGQPISLQEMSSYSPDIVFRIFSCFKGAFIAELQHVDSADPEQAARALDQIQKMADELVSCQCCFIVGQPSDFAVQHPWFRKTPSMTSIPREIMENALDQAGLRAEQLAEIQHLWQQHRGIKPSLEEGEEVLRTQLRGQLNQASGLPDCQGLYSPMMDTVVELEANWKAQANRAFQWEFSVIAKVLEPLQLAKINAFLMPYPFRLDLMVASGLMQPKESPQRSDPGTADQVAEGSLS